MRHQLALRIEAAAFLDDADPLQLERAHAVLFVGRHLARHVGELALAAQALLDRLPPIRNRRWLHSSTPLGASPTRTEQGPPLPRELESVAGLLVRHRSSYV